MRFAFILAFVGSLFVANLAEADSAARKPVKTQKRRAVAKAKPKAKPKKTAKADEVVIQEEAAPPPKAEPAPVKRSSAPVAQATDDETPRNEPKKKR